MSGEMQAMSLIEFLMEKGDLAGLYEFMQFLYRGGEDDRGRDLKGAMVLLEAIQKHPLVYEDFRLLNHFYFGEILTLQDNHDEALKHYELAKTSTLYYGEVKDHTEMRIAEALYLKEDIGCIPLYRGIIGEGDMFENEETCFCQIS